ncbi:unnamed protein product [Caenorhabditis bovis]|uniref:Macro domain-containing protein n=1 Tax=Caenorhabditis bovis TaxID=2654633 RepID=A0A8S1EPN5_9PELO|nr:unnamed protein product [Caenorhabditis bovis]
MNSLPKGVIRSSTLKTLRQHFAEKNLFASNSFESWKDDVLKRVSVWRGDICKLEVDAIVNAANRSLAGGGGVDGAIHRAAGYDRLQSECRKYGYCDVGRAVITSGCNIRHIKNIIHTVGPQVYGVVGEKEKNELISCYSSSLELAKKNGLKTIAFCCISTGVYGYPNEDAAKAVTEFLSNYLKCDQNNDKIERVVLVTFLDIDYNYYLKYFREFFNQEEKSASASTEKLAGWPSKQKNYMHSGDGNETQTKKKKVDRESYYSSENPYMSSSDPSKKATVRLNEYP